MVDLSRLSETQLCDTANVVGQLWWEKRGLQALICHEYVRQHEADAFAAATSADTEISQKESAAIYGLALEAILESDDEEAKTWVARAAANAQAPKLQMIDPFLGGSLLLISACIGVSSIILAARIKSAGNVKFEKGLPKDLAKIVKAAVYAPVDMAKTLTAKLSDLSAGSD